MFNFKIVRVPRLRNYEGASQRLENPATCQKRDFTSLERTSRV